jgi:nucleotide-binding universal stress UspA family protein
MKGRYEHIACCVVPSTSSRWAVREASRRRMTEPGKLSLVHVVEGSTDEAAQRAWAWLEGESRRVPHAEPALLAGTHPAPAICSWAGAHGVDLLVTSTDHVRAGEGGRSVAAYLLEHAPCQVIVVRPGDPRGHPSGDHDRELELREAQGVLQVGAHRPEHAPRVEGDEERQRPEGQGLERA